jgi:hypothetical protein
MRGLPHRLFSWSWSVGNVTMQRLFLAKLSRVFYFANENVLLCKISECLVPGVMHVMVRERGLAGLTQIVFSLCCYTLYTSASRGTQIGFSQVRVQPVHTRPPASAGACPSVNARKRGPHGEARTPSPARRRLLACGLLPCPAPMRARRRCGRVPSPSSISIAFIGRVPRRTPAALPMTRWY